MKQEKLIGEDLNRLSKIVDMTDEDYQGSGSKVQVNLTIVESYIEKDAYSNNSIKFRKKKDTLLEKDNLFGNDLGVFLATPTDNIDGNRKCYKR